MKRKGIITLGILASVSFLTAGFTMRPTQADPNENAYIYVIDVAKVISETTKFKNTKAMLETKVNEQKKEIEAEQNLLNGKVEEYRNATDADVRSRLEQQINSMKFDLEQKSRKYTTEMQQTQMDLYNTLYGEMSDLLTRYCEKHQIPMVIRKNDLPADQRTNEALNYQLNQMKQVIYHHKALDLTDTIITGLNG